MHQVFLPRQPIEHNHHPHQLGIFNGPARSHKMRQRRAGMAQCQKIGGQDAETVAQVDATRQDALPHSSESGVLCSLYCRSSSANALASKRYVGRA